LSVLLAGALAAQCRGQSAVALSTVAQALEQVANHGGLQCLRDEASLQPLYQRLADEGNASPPVTALLAQLLDAPPHSSSGLLTVQEQHILEHLANGERNGDIAGRLHISEGTVKWHLHNMYRKLDAATRTQAVARARALRLV